MSKNRQRNTLNAPPSKKYDLWDEFRHLDSYERVTINEDTMFAWAKDIRDWIDKNPEVMKFSLFCKSKRIDPDEFDRLCIKYPELMSAKKYALREIGERRLEAAAFKGANWAPIKLSLYQYGKEFVDAEKFHADLKKEVEETKVQLALMMVNRTQEGDEERKKLANKKKKTITVESE